MLRRMKKATKMVPTRGVGAICKLRTLRIGKGCTAKEGGHNLGMTLGQVATDSTQGSSGDPETEPQKNKESDKKAFLDLKKFSKSGPEMLSETAEDLDFNGNLEQNRLAEAQKLLVASEERLFGSNKPARAEEEEGELMNNYQCFITHLEMIIKDSFIENNHERLKSAVTAILQEEAQDKRWEALAVEKRPSWRLTTFREIHDKQLKDVVEERMKNANEQENGADKLSTPLMREVCRLGKQIQKYLLVVVRRLRECYPPDFDICKIYAQLYHQAFSIRLKELTRSNVDIKDCCYILSWIVFNYPNDVLNHKELKGHIDQSSLEPLLPEGTLKILHEQYFLHKEKEVRKWLSNAFGKEFRKWSDGVEPQLMDGVYFSSLDGDIIPLIDSCMKEIKSVFGSESKNEFILCQLDSYLKDYRKNLEEFIKVKQGGAAKTELLGELHLAVMVEYVRRMMKKKLKLKKKKHQEEAAEFMCQDSKSICSTFAKAGSDEKWLSEILPRLSEILRLQDPGSLKLEIVTLARIYPDLSQQHVVAVLKLKSNLSSSDLCGIKDCLLDNRDQQDDHSSPSFFSKVIVKKKISHPLLSFPK